MSELMNLRDLRVAVSRLAGFYEGRAAHVKATADKGSDEVTLYTEFSHSLTDMLAETYTEPKKRLV